MDNKIEFLSVVVPVYNDAEVLCELHKRLLPVVSVVSKQYEIIFIDDGSHDSSWQEILLLSQKNKNVVGVKLVRNFGQQNSIAAGLDVVRGDMVVLMDSDLQDRPEDIPTLIQAMEEAKVSMAIAQWTSRNDATLKKMVSNLFFKVSNNITSIHTQPHLGVFRIMKREIIEELKQFSEKTSTTLSLLYYIGSNYVCVPLKRDARYAGKSGYNLHKMLSLTFARIFSFSLFPIRLATYSGFVITIVSFIVGIIIIIKKLFGMVAPGWTSIIVLILFLFGLNFAFLGIIGEYIGRIFSETKQRPKYIIEKIVK